MIEGTRFLIEDAGNMNGGEVTSCVTNVVQSAVRPNRCMYTCNHRIMESNLIKGDYSIYCASPF